MMTCEEFLRLLDQSGTLNEDEKKAMREHAAGCAECAEIMRLREDLSHLDEGVEVPDGFAPAWRRLIREDEKVEKTVQKKRPWLKWMASAAAAVFLIGGTMATRGMWEKAELPVTSAYANNGTYGAMNRTLSMEDSMPMPEANMDYSASSKMAASAAKTAQTAKIIREASFTIKTQTFDSDYEAMIALVADMGGRVEYSSVSGDVSVGALRTAWLTLRIPTNRLDEFLSSASGVGEMTDMTQSTEDVSETYYDLQSRLDTQIAKMERLKELMSMTENVADLIEVESAIADTQYMIDSYQSRLNGYDSRIEDSAVTLNIREVRVSETIGATLGERISSAISDSAEEFVNFLQDMLIFLLAALPWLIAAAVVITVIVIVVKKKRGGK